MHAILCDKFSRNQNFFRTWFLHYVKLHFVILDIVNSNCVDLLCVWVFVITL